MGAQGTTTVNFGAFPGAGEATATIIGQGSILSGSLVEAWIMPTATADHSADEHWVDPPLVIAGNVVAATGFTIYAQSPTRSQNVPDYIDGDKEQRPVNDGRFYGQYTVAWVWN